MSSDTTLQTTEAGVDTDIRQRDIVVGVDGSDESFAALRWALQEASLTGQRVNAVYGWTHSWDMGSEPDSEEQWAAMRHGIAKRLRDWVAQASSGMAINEDRVKLTSVRASGTAALLEIGKDAQQIVVGRRSLGRVARWFLGSLSASLAEEAKVPVTVVRILDDEEASVQDAIANALTPAIGRCVSTCPVRRCRRTNVRSWSGWTARKRRSTRCSSPLSWRPFITRRCRLCSVGS